MKNWIKLVISIVLPQLAGLAGALFTQTGESSWFQTLAKPDWNPPSWLFGPVWTTLYILMGIAFYLVWKSDKDERIKKPAMTMWVVQLIFNAAWSFIFFGAQEMGLAFAEIIILWLLILVTIFLFARVNKTAAWLLVPYISWVSFAAILNYTIWQLNT
jgi:translocator protein